jgi:hypothetical protein
MINMTNYEERYPGCANCPKLAKIQATRDQMMGSFEEAVIRDELNSVAKEHDREQTDQGYALFLDRVQSGSLPEDNLRVLDAEATYALLDTTHEAEMKKSEADRQIAQQMIERLAQLVPDNEADLLASHCKKGPRQISILGRHAIFCRSSAKGYTIQ